MAHCTPPKKINKVMPLIDQYLTLSAENGISFLLHCTFQNFLGEGGHAPEPPRMKGFVASPLSQSPTLPAASAGNNFSPLTGHVSFQIFILVGHLNNLTGH